jgi:hypothetical protein
MKKVFNIGLPLIAIASVLTGCTPSLVTDMFTDKFPPESADDVQVFLVGEELPDSALTIGRLKVVDNGLAVKVGNTGSEHTGLLTIWMVPIEDSV